MPGTMQRLAFADLDLDPLNPRLPVSCTGLSDDGLIQFVANTYDAIDIARSIARYGYFETEPVIAIPNRSRHMVVEGNRRLAALKILFEPGRLGRLELDDADEWRRLAAGTTSPADIPVLVVADRQEVAPIVGYRHIAGIIPWDPFAQARFISGLMTQPGMTFETVGHVVGKRPTEVKAAYRNFHIADAARRAGVRTDEAEKRFGVFTRAMNNPGLRRFIGAPSSTDVAPGRQQFEVSRTAQVRELLVWLFGDQSRSPAIAESREIDQLGAVVANDDAIRVLRDTGDLHAAFATSGGLLERLLNRLTQALANLVNAEADMADHASQPRVRDLVTRCAEVVERLRRLLP